MKNLLNIRLLAIMVFGLVNTVTTLAQQVLLPKSIIVEQVTGFGLCTYHTVEKGNTIYSIGKAYHVEVLDILDANPKKNLVTLKLDDRIRIPVTGKFIDDFNTNGEYRNNIPVYYKAKKGDNLFRISNVYFNLSIADVKKFNKMSNISLQPDQLVLVGYKTRNSSLKPSENKAITKTTDNKSAKLAEDKKVSSSAEKLIASKSLDKPASKTPTLKNSEVKKPVKDSDATSVAKGETKKNVPAKEKELSARSNGESKLKFEKIIKRSADEPGSDSIATIEEAPVRKLRKENGVAVWNPASQSTGIFALHRDAIPGSQLEVYNPFSKKSMSVTVIGGIPETAYQPNVKVILSPETAKALGALDERFYVKMSYVK